VRTAESDSHECSHDLGCADGSVRRCSLSQTFSRN
jgi:hypothetical protein